MSHDEKMREVQKMQEEAALQEKQKAKRLDNPSVC